MPTAPHVSPVPDAPPSEPTIADWIRRRSIIVAQEAELLEQAAQGTAESALADDAITALEEMAEELKEALGAVPTKLAKIIAKLKRSQEWLQTKAELLAELGDELELKAEELEGDEEEDGEAEEEEDSPRPLHGPPSFAEAVEACGKRGAS